MDYLQTQINSTFGKHLTKVGFELSSAPGLKRELAKASRGSDYTKGDSQKLGAALAAYARGTSESVPYLITGTAYVSSITHDKKLNLYRAAVSLSGEVLDSKTGGISKSNAFSADALAFALSREESVTAALARTAKQVARHQVVQQLLIQTGKTAEAGQGVQHSCLL